MPSACWPTPSRRRGGAQAWDLLSRLYLPLQETRRQRRQRCGEGTIWLDLVARSEENTLTERIDEDIETGQLLAAGWGSTEAAVQLRRMAEQQKQYLDVFLAAVYPVGNKRVIAVVPMADDPMPAARPRSLDELRQALPRDCLIIPSDELPEGRRKGSTETYAYTMALWERLHAPFLARAERESDLLQKMRLFRETIVVDYGCEFAHQHLADAARQLRRESGISA